MCVLHAGPLWLIIEFATHGNLRAHLRSKRPQSEQFVPIGPVVEHEAKLPEKDAFGYAIQVSRGMEYLISRHVGSSL